MDAVSAIQGVDVHKAMQQAATPSPALDAVGHRFAELLSQDPATRALPDVGAPNALSSLVHQQEQAYRGLMQDMVKLPEQSAHMSSAQMSVKHVEMMFRIAQVGLQANGFSYVAQSTKNGLQTLMKNQ